MTGKQISVAQVKVMELFVAERKQWLDSNTVINKTKIPSSTVRHLLLMFFKFGLLEKADMFGAYRYRLSAEAEQQPYFLRLMEAAAVIQQ